MDIRQAIQKRPIQRVSKSDKDFQKTQTRLDAIAVEAPLEISLAYSLNGQRHRQNIAVTMRTPTGDDADLALGFLYTEGVISGKKEVAIIRYLAENAICVELHPSVKYDLARLNRHFYTSSSCGICGKAAIEAIETAACFILQKEAFPIERFDLFTLPQKLRARQTTFDQTGGIHAAALVQGSEIIALKEDVGRHNAVDKLIGWALQNARLPLSESLVLVSSRASFELVQKALMAGIPCLAAMGAPSSLAVELAAANGMWLIGFLSETRYNVYV
jgi:FdhD protein